MLRRTRTELIETIERSRAIYSLLGWKYNETEKMWRATPPKSRLSRCIDMWSKCRQN